jgi:hypothetical protein
VLCGDEVIQGPGVDWSLWEFDEMIFVSVDDDAHWEVVVQGRFMTGIGPEGSHPFPAKEGFCAKTNDEYFLKCANVRYPLPPDIGRVC